ncbi:hypothetical protein [Trujillonella endophytica]|uniref:Uncharacterized protein n=1 Tax=Trujillonella endophytica TaxID=673521 RepID=A0A1H8PX21_9ACTN|nr:hypothetical protein [Trujillella endophytica]SEO46083.1 hypothetical protein SAMN05660991_00415 [Trujillella endophytica]
MDSSEAQVLADLEQELLAPAVRRLRRRFCAVTAVAAAAAVGAFAVLGLAALPVLYVVLLAGGLVLVARATDRPGLPAPDGLGDGRPERPRHRHRHPLRHRHPRRQPLGCSTKS